MSFSVPISDFDEQTADDWDVDMSVYYEKGISSYCYSVVMTLVSQH